MILRDYQSQFKQAIYDSWNTGHRNVIGVSPTGCHGVGTNVVMFDGKNKAVEDIRIGDILMGPDSTPRFVLELHRGTDTMVEVMPTKGEPFVVNEGHVFHLWKTKEGNRHPRELARYKEITCCDALDMGKWAKHIHKLHRGHIDLPAVGLPLDPYVLGALIGDGCLVDGTPSICTPDNEIIHVVAKCVAKFGCKLTRSKDTSRCQSFNIIHPASSRRVPNPLTVMLRALGLWGTHSWDKFVPSIYKYSSTVQRLKIIAGLLDTDGHMTRGGFDWISKSETLADDMVWLCRSVGLAAYKAECAKSNQDGFTGVYYRVGVSGDCSIIPCKVPRKIAPKRKQIKRHDVTGFTLKRIGTGEYFGFTLTGDHLYMTSDFIVHHNSGKTAVMSSIASDAPGAPSVAIAHRQELVGQISVAMANMGVHHNLIAPKQVVQFCVSQHVKLFGQSFYNRNAPFAVAGVDTLIRRGDDIFQWRNAVTQWMTDECFPADTLVDGKPIQDIRVGDMVTAFDEETGEFHKRKVLRTFKNQMPEEMIEISQQCGKRIHVTSNHPFWTQRGWVPAGQLITSDELLSKSGWVNITGVCVLGFFDTSEFVYNIEVDEFHTYIANGIVVHNCHHALTNNKWGKAIAMFPNARGLGFTATPIRCDRKSLAAAQGGVFHDMVIGPTMRELIDQGFLADYRIFGPPQSMDMSHVDVSKNTGEYTLPSLRKEAERSTITGDIVDHYMRIAPGKRGITFTVDVDQAVATAAAFNAAGVRAEAVSAKTPDSVRTSVIEKFARGDITQLVNVDLFGEGFDVPAVEVVSMGRPTQSYGLYIQQFGRALRPLEGKTHGILIDHVGNVKRHGLPDAPRVWSLMSEERGRRAEKDPDVVPVTTCVECFRAYEAITATCPFCGHHAEPESRGAPQFVDGDLIEFSPELLAQLRGEIEKIDGPARLPAGVNPAILGGARKNHRLRQEAQVVLRDCIAMWAGIERDVKGRGDSEIYRRFYHRFGIDILSAQGLKTADANKLTGLIRETYDE